MESTVTNGVETWKFNKNLQSKLMSMETDIFQEIGEILKIIKIINNIIREKINSKNSVLDYIRDKQLNRYGCLRRMKKSYFKKCWNGVRLKEEEREGWKNKTICVSCISSFCLSYVI